MEEITVPVIQHGEQPSPPSPIVGKETRNTVILGLSFLFVFTAFSGIENLQSSLNDEGGLGVISLSCVYGAFVISGLLAPIVIGMIGIKMSVIVSFVCHLLYTTSNMYPTFATLIPTSVLLGIVSGLLWTCQSTYTSECALSLSRTSGDKLFAVLSRLNGMFFMLYEMSQITGNLISSIVLQQGSYNQTIGNNTEFCGRNDCPLTDVDSSIADPEKSVTFILIGVYITCDVVGLAVIILFLSPLLKKRTIKNQICNIKTSLCSCCKMFVRSDLPLLVPFMMFHAINEVFVYADLTKSFVSCPVGLQMVGYIMASYGASTSVFNFTFGRLAKYTKRYVLFSFASFVNMALFVWLFIWTPSNEHVPFMFLTSLGFGICAGIWQVQTKSMLAILYPRNKESAFAVYETMRAIGYTLAFAFSSFMCVSIKILVCMGTLGVGFALYVIVEIRLRRKFTAIS